MTLGLLIILFYLFPRFAIGECSAAPSDIVFVIDSSTSVGENNFQKVLNFIKNFLSGAEIGPEFVQVGILLYSTDINIQFHLNDYKEKGDVLAAIDRIKYRYGSTNTAGGIEAMRRNMFTIENGDRPYAKNIAFIVTDGVSNINAYKTMEEARKARSEDIHIYSIGIGLDETTELMALASEPADKNTFTVEDFDGLENLKKEVFDTFCPTTEPPTTPPTTPVPTTECTVTSSDVVFLLDSSTSVLETNFRKILAFVKEFLSEAYFGASGVRVGLVTYSTHANVQFYLNSHETKEEIFNAVDKVPYTYGSTNTAGGLEKLRKEMFTREHGDRPESRNIAIVVTDGVSNVNSYRTLDEAALLKDAEVHVYGVGIGLVEINELRQIVSVPAEENTFLAQNFDDLQGLKKLVFAEMCPVPPTTTPIPTTTEKCSAATSDIAFLLDSSTSVSEANFKKVLSFVKEFLSTAYIAADGVRVSVTTYSTSVHVEFLLDRYTTREEIYGAIDRIPYRYGSTNTADGLKAIRQQVFSVETGDRPDAPNFLFVVTDGVSNLNAYRTIEEAEMAKKKDIHIYAIGVGLADTNELKKMASEPTDANTYIVQEFSELKGVQAELFEEFCPVETTPPPTEPTPEPCRPATSDVVFLLDASTSVSERNFKKVLQFVKQFLTEAYIAPDGVRVGVITFSSYAYVQFNLNKFTTKEQVFEAVDNIPYSYGSTNTAAGLQALRAAFSRNKGDRPEAPNYALVVTDGVSNINSYQTISEAEITRNSDIHIYAIGVGLSDTSELEKIASRPSRENTFNVQDFNELQGVKKDLFQEFCPDMAPRRIITTPAPRPTTTKPIFSMRGKCSAATADIVFVLDSSTSVSERNFKKMLNFVKDFLHDATISPEFVRVGVLVYSTSVYIQFHLNEYKTKEEVFAAIDRIQYTYGSTNTAAALKVMRNTMFSKHNGNRDNVHNIAVVVTDGVSNINSHQTVMEAEKAKMADIHIYAIGVGLTETNELEKIASAPAEENKFAVQDFDELHGLRAKVFKEFCPETCISTSLDIVFLLDSSTSMEERNFKKMIAFVKDLLSNATIDSGIVRVGVATYSTGVRVEFNLNDYSTKAEIFDALDRIRYRYGNTNTAGALHTMRTRMFTASRGDRENSIDVAILMTDGVSNINTNRITIEANAARDRGIQVYAIGIALAETSELIKIASEPAEDYTMNVQDFRELQGLKGRLFDFCDLGR